MPNCQELENEALTIPVTFFSALRPKATKATHYDHLMHEYNDRIAENAHQCDYCAEQLNQINNN